MQPPIMPNPIRPVPINASHRVQSITPMPQVQRSNMLRPISRSPTPFQNGTRMQQLETIFQENQNPPMPPTSISLLARGISLLSITQLRELLREYSLPTGGNKHILVNRLIIFLETFGHNQQNILVPFSAKLKHLLSVEPEERSQAPPEDDLQPLPIDVAQRVFQNSPSCLFQIGDIHQSAFGPIMHHFTNSTQVYTFNLVQPSSQYAPILQFAPLVDYQISKVTLQISGTFITLMDQMLWMDLSDYMNKPLSIQIVSIEPPMTVGMCVRWLKRVGLLDLTARICELEPCQPAPLIGPPPNGICPLTRKIIARPARGASCCHGECFDLTGYLCYSLKNKLWQCPICHKPLQPEQIRIDPHFFQLCTPVSQ